MKTKVKKRLFVSRDLGEDSPFLNLKIDFEIIGHSMLDIEPIELTFIPLAHWYVFYSKNAIQAFELNMKKQNFNFPSGSRFICMGRSSEKKLYDVLGQKASIIVESLDPKYEDKIKEEIRHGHVCFVSAKESTKRFQNLFPQSQKTICTVYESVPRKNISIVEADLYVFTSPKNFNYFISKNQINSSSQIIAIGTTTAAEIRKHYPNHNVRIPKYHHEEDVVALIKSEIVR